jgi:hypothetical protein
MSVVLLDSKDDFSLHILLQAAGEQIKNQRSLVQLISAARQTDTRSFIKRVNIPARVESILDIFCRLWRHKKHPRHPQNLQQMSSARMVPKRLGSAKSG